MSGLAVGIALAFGGAVARAADVTIPVKVYLNKPAKKTKFVSKGSFALPAADPNNPDNPLGGKGGSITFSSGASSEEIDLTGANWKGLGNPEGTKGYKYKDPSGAGCKVVLVKGTVIKGLCKATAAGAPPYDAADPNADPISIVLSLGTASQNYCGECPNGGQQKGNPDKLTKFKDCGAPTECPSTLVACTGGCCDSGYLVFRTDQGSGATTGGLKKADGSAIGAPLVESGLYFRGGGGSVPLPSIVPDMGEIQYGFANCNASTGAFDIVSRDDTDTGSVLNCSAAGISNGIYPRTGCLFGAPLSIPNSASPNTSTCVINRVTTNASGSANCNGSASLIDLPLGSDIFLTGDYLDGSGVNQPNVPGINPCPICDPNTDTCLGGPNNGGACTAGSSALNDGYPTSHDCPPDEGDFIGTLPIPFQLTTGTSTKVSADYSAQSRVFCGFCADEFASTFEPTPTACDSDSDCSGFASFPKCKQRTSGAFGSGDVRTITETGSPANVCLDTSPGEHPATLVSVFCIPPSFDSTVDSAGDLPSPGAVALPGSVEAVP
jgi:hypothetical protein